MLVTTDHIDPTLLQRTVPRSLPLSLPFVLLVRYLMQNPWYTYCDPFLLSCAVAAIAMTILRIPWLLSAVLVSLVVVRLGTAAWHAATEIAASLALLRHGKLLRAHILRARPFRHPDENIDGIFLDCAIPTASRRIVLGSVWLADGAAANRLKARGFLQVICLERVPSTWMLLDDINADLRHYPLPR